MHTVYRNFNLCQDQVSYNMLVINADMACYKFHKHAYESRMPQSYAVPNI